jgi:branched-chain amino acid transport system substrate-binding protein
VTALPSSSCGALQYEGEGDPDYILASDFPLQGSSRTQTEQIVAAIQFELEQRGWKAGDYNIAFQSCDDATAQAAKWDSAKCSQNGNAYAANDAVISVIGTFNSGCAAIIIPLLNEAPEGGIAMMSPANTYPCLTVNLPGGCDASEPAKYYPTGSRNYARVAPADDYQGAFVAEFMQKQGIKSVYILNDKEAYGLGVATTTRKAAEHVGIKVAGFEAWDPKASSYEALMNKIKGTDADAVFLGGLIDENGAQVIKDKVAVLGPNDGDVMLLAPDGFTAQATIDEAGQENAAGMFSSVAGVPPEELTGAGAEFISAFEEALGGEPVEPYSAYGAQAMQVALDAIAAAGDKDRPAIIEALLQTEVTDGILGSFGITEEGDPTSGPITIYVAGETFTTEEVITPSEELVAAAMGG